MGSSKIEWTEKTWNPVTGCTPVSPGCDHCYAARMATRLAGRAGYPADNPFAVTCHPDKLDQPLHWRKPCRVFVCSMGDLFHPDVPDSFIDQVFAIMAACPQHTFQVLTKRPERMVKYLHNYGHAHLWDRIYAAARTLPEHKVLKRNLLNIQYFPAWPLPNVWLGVTCEDQQRADERIPLLLQCPAAVRFVSCEPLLGPVDLGIRCNVPGMDCVDCPAPECSLRGNERQVDWVICGGETGPGARPMHPDWARSLRDQCKAAGVAFFFKQWGGWVPETQNTQALTERTARTALYVEPDGTTRPAKYGARGEAATVQRVGKKRAGRLLDGVEYSEYPEVRA